MSDSGLLGFDSVQVCCLTVPFQRNVMPLSSGITELGPGRDSCIHVKNQSRITGVLPAMKASIVITNNAL